MDIWNLECAKKCKSISEKYITGRIIVKQKTADFVESHPFNSLLQERKIGCALCMAILTKAFSGRVQTAVMKLCISRDVFLCSATLYVSKCLVFLL